MLLACGVSRHDAVMLPIPGLEEDGLFFGATKNNSFSWVGAKSWAHRVVLRLQFLVRICAYTLPNLGARLVELIYLSQSEVVVWMSMYDLLVLDASCLNLLQRQLYYFKDVRFVIN